MFVFFGIVPPVIPAEAKRRGGADADVRATGRTLAAAPDKRLVLSRMRAA